MTTAVTPRPLAHAMGRALEQAVAAARAAECRVVAGASAAVDDVDELWLFQVARRRGLEAVVWRPPDGSRSLALGNALTLTARGASRLAALGDRWRAVRSSALIGTSPRAFVAVSFDDERSSRGAGPRWQGYPSAVLAVPRLLLERRDASWVAHAFAAVDPDTDADREVAALDGLLDVVTDPGIGGAGAPGARRSARVEDVPEASLWREAVTAIRADVRAGRVEKAVLARAVRVSGAIDVEGALAMLVSRSVASTVFGVALARRCFIGASPESLVRLSGGVATVSCLAGTAPRDLEPSRDADRARDLAASAKEREEHGIVAREARAALAPLCDDVVLDHPRPVALASLWHLTSEVRGRARPGVELFDLAAALHPTPAVCGYPREAARRLLAEREPFDRGWYAGALGWVDGRGEGDLAVALRSALCAPDEAWLFAGCGIVGASDPDAELAESEAKLRPMLEALGAA